MDATELKEIKALIYQNASSSLWAEVHSVDENGGLFLILPGRTEPTGRSYPHVSHFDPPVAGDKVITIRMQSGGYFVLGKDQEDAKANLEYLPLTGGDVQPETNPASGGTLLRVLSAGGAERLRVEHDGRLYTANSVIESGAGVMATRGYANQAEAAAEAYARNNFVSNGPATNFSGGHFNNLRGSGFFRAPRSSTPGGPPRGAGEHAWVYMVQMEHNANYIVQTATDFNNARTYQRVRRVGTWEAWKQIGGDPEFRAANLFSGWSNYGNGMAAPSYQKNAEGLVTLAGTIYKAYPNYPDNLFVLEAGFRPVADHTFITGSLEFKAVVAVYDGGYVSLIQGEGWSTTAIDPVLPLDGISFYAGH